MNTGFTNLFKEISTKFQIKKRGGEKGCRSKRYGRGRIIFVCCSRGGESRAQRQ